MMRQFNIFYFEKFDFDLDTGKATFNYSFDKELFFEENIYFFDKNFVLRENLNLDIIKNILFHIHIALGISYYKLYLSEKLVVETGNLDENQINFWKKFYLNGLGEFFFRNNFNPKDILKFESNNLKKYQKIDFETSEKYLVSVGGGKDSIVSVELLKKFDKKIDLVTFAQNDNVLYENTSKISGFKRLYIKRNLHDLRDLINAGAYNGHVPITGIIAFVLELASYLYDYKFIVLSNEYSANFGNTSWNGIEVNHQWSKSLDFEIEFGKYVESYISNVKYFSLLRPFYELKIAEIFSKVGKKYFKHFSSCNVNFKIFKKDNQKSLINENERPPLAPPYEGDGVIPPIDKGRLGGTYWCNSCPKCAFVYSILRPFLTKEETIEIFSKELYEDKNLETLFRELLGISGIKPFECVGTNEEVTLAMKMTLKNWEGDLPYILEIFKNEVDINMKKEDYENLKEKILKGNFENNLIPKELKENLKIL